MVGFRSYVLHMRCKWAFILGLLPGPSYLCGGISSWWLGDSEVVTSRWGSCSGLMSRVMKTPGKVNAFMEQEPRKVAAFVGECLEYRQFEAPDLLPYFTILLWYHTRAEGFTYVSFTH
jgi:hypothetical protein